MFKRTLLLLFTTMLFSSGIESIGQTVHSDLAEQMVCEFYVQGYTLKGGKEEISGEAARSIVTLDENGFAVVNPLSVLGEGGEKSDRTKVIYNRQTKRIISLDYTSKEFSDIPVHGLVKFKVNELQHRNAMCKAFEAAGIERKMRCTPLELESALGLQLPSLFEKSEELKIVESVKGSEHVFLANGKEIARFNESEMELKPSLLKSFGAYLSHHEMIHPQIRHAIIKSGKLPQMLSYELLTLMHDDEETSFKLVKKLKSTKLARDSEWDLVPQEFRKSYSHLPDELAEIIPQLQTELTKRPSAIETRAQTKNQIQVFLKEQKDFAALMQSFRYREVTGDDAAFGEFVRLTLDSAKSHPILRKFSTGEMEQEDWVQLISIVSQQDEKSSAVAEYLFADSVMAQQWAVDAHALLISALGKDPLLSGAYLDLGRLYSNEFMMDAEWTCVDISREIAPTHTNLHPVGNLMRALEKDFPDFF